MELCPNNLPETFVIGVEGGAGPAKLVPRCRPRARCSQQSARGATRGPQEFSSSHGCVRGKAESLALARRDSSS
jgi:hypothetical protein